MNKTPISFPEYFLTHENIICHTISENCIYKGKIIGLPKYFPIGNKEETINTRVINNIIYHDHLKSFYDSINQIREIRPDYLKYIPFFGEELCLFDINSDIRIVYDPKTTAKTIYENNYEDQIYIDTKYLISILINTLDIPISDIGIEGSIMLGGYKKNSDIDMVIYGIHSNKKLEEGFYKLGYENNIHLYNENNIELILSRRGKYKSFDSEKELLQQEQRRSVGLINGRRFWAQPIIGNNSNEIKNQNRHLINYDIIEDYFEVRDSKYYLWPSFYTIYNKKYGIINLECYDPIYMNQCKNGDRIKLRGKLYKDNKNGKSYIILAPWIFTQQYLKNSLFIK